jgi:hypothetical protein
MKPLRELCKWEVFDDGEGTFYVVVNPDHPNYPICDWMALKPSYHHWFEFPEEVRVIGMMFLVEDKD